MQIRVLLGTCLLSAGLVGCAPQRNAAGDPQGLTAQRYELELVLERVRELPLGTSQARTMIALGSPAFDGFEYWRYVDGRPGVLAPTREVRVYFEGGVYAGYEVRPVVLGVPW
ncbi:MAG: hypothetical protein AAF288_11300 [Planctomycetota bacterium]